MNAKYLLVALPVLAMGLAGCKQQAVVPGEQTVKEAVGEAMEMGQAIESGDAVVCTMTSANGAVMTYQFKAGKMRADGMQMGSTDRAGSMINDMMYIYTWESGATEGMKIAIPKETPGPQPTEAAVSPAPEIPDFSDENTIDNYEQQGFTVDCKPGEIDDSVFVPPAEVTFTDPTALMQGVLNKIPTGLEQVGQSGMSPEFQERLQQFQNQMPSEE